MTESVDALLARLSLSKYAAIFADEAISDVELLTSMGGDLLLENMAEIGVAAADAEILRAALFDSRRSSDGELCLESNAAGDDDSGGELLLEENDGAPTGTPAPAPAAPAREEDAAALRDAERLLRPLAQFDLPELKRRLLRLRADGDRHFARKRYANAEASYSAALALEAPNARANAALWYNRAACHQHLGQPRLAELPLHPDGRGAAQRPARREQRLPALDGRWGGADLPRDGSSSSSSSSPCRQRGLRCDDSRRFGVMARAGAGWRGPRPAAGRSAAGGLGRRPRRAGRAATQKETTTGNG